MTEQTPDPVDSGEFDIDETAVEDQKTTNVVDEQDDVELAADQEPVLDVGNYDADDEDDFTPPGGAQ